jgi:hypothetical protein
MASLQATIGCAYLLYVYAPDTPRACAPILHVRAPVTLLASNLLAPAQTTIGSAHEVKGVKGRAWAGNR